MSKADVVAMICRALSEGDTSKAGAIANERYPFAPGIMAARKHSERQQFEVFLRDGFTDRYSGEKLLFPGTLRLLSRVLPQQFPFHPNWKLSATHMVWWELAPTLDHV